MGKKTKKPSKAKGKTLLLAGAMPRAYLVEVGGRWNGHELVSLWQAVRSKVEAHHAQFEALGFTTAWASQMDALVGEIESAAEHKSAAVGDALPTSAALNDAIAKCKEWRRAAATRVAISPKLAARAPKIQTGSSPGALEKSIRSLLPLVASSDSAVPGGAAFKTQGQKLLADLGAQLKKHKAAVGKVSPAVRDHNEKEGVFYEELKRLSRAARDVIPEEAHLFAPSNHARTRMRSRDRGAKPNGGVSKAPIATSGSTETG